MDGTLQHTAQTFFERHLPFPSNEDEGHCLLSMFEPQTRKTFESVVARTPDTEQSFA